MSGFVTEVPQPTFGPNGVVIPTENAILAGVQSDINTALGGGVDPLLSTPQGQIASSETAIIGDNFAMFLWFVNNVDPALNEGRMQDAIGRLYFQTRIAGTATIQGCICAGLDGTPIPIGALAQDENNNVWICQQAGSIVGGSVTLNFASVTNGPLAGPASMTIYQSIFGWESITPTGAAVLGTNTETAAEYETRRQNSVAANANQILDAIQGKVLAVNGVLDAFVTENDTGTSQTIGGVTIDARSIFVCALGGTTADVAFAMWSKKGGGCGWTGTTTVTVTDPNPAYNPPAPTYQVSFTIATVVAFAVLVTIKNNSLVPVATALGSVQTAIVQAFAGLDGGTRAKIGSLVFASRYYGDIAMLGQWAQIVQIQVGILGGACSFTGSISATTLTVSAIASGALAAGQLIQDAGLLASGTLIVTQLSGSAGSTGTYQVSILQSITSEAMTATTLQNDVQMNINQAPGISTGNVNMILA
jgi:hypothetical protein